jgi:hypothetical protein
VWSYAAKLSVTTQNHKRFWSVPCQARCGTLIAGALSQQNFVDFVDFLEADFDIAAAF